jgi:hypothetical protein
LIHNGIDIDQYLLFTIYPTAVFFGLGFLAKMKQMKESIKYTLQAIGCITFSIYYFVAVPNGGADGLVIVLAIFSSILFFMARNYLVHPEGRQSQANSTANKLG